MELDVYKETPVSSSADAIWEMSQTHEYPLDIWGHYRQMTDFIDVVNYLRFVMTDEDPVTAKYGQRAMTWLGFAIPSLAYIAPSQTTDLSYFEHLVLFNGPADYLRTRYSYYGSDNVTLAHLALDAAFYRLISGRDTYDTRVDADPDDRLYGKIGFHELVEQLKNIIDANAASAQGVTALDTVRGRYDALPNLIVMMAFELHDRFFGTDYARYNVDILDFVEHEIQDPVTKLFFTSYETSYLGFPGEELSPQAHWCMDELSPAVNALALTFYNYFRPDVAREAYANFKILFNDQLLALTADDIAASFGGSYQSSLGAESEALFGALALAREMGDQEYFGILQDRLWEIGAPVMREGQIHFTQFGDAEAIMGMFLTFCRTHIPWKTLFEHDWETYYSYNCSVMH